MSVSKAEPRRDLAQLLSEAGATIEALLSGQVDAVVDPKSNTAVLVSSAQKALRESEASYRSIVETASEGIWTIDSSSTVTFVNRVITEMLGYSPAEMLGRSLSDFLPEGAEDRAAHRRWVEQSRQGVSEEIEVRLVRKAGSVLWALLKTSPIRDTDGKYVGTLAMMTDRTQRREAEEALRKSEEQYRQIVETTSDGIIKTDRSLIVVFVNRRFAEMLGYESHELIGASVFTFMNAAARAAATAAFERRKAGVRDAFDTTFRHKNGTDISVNVVGSPLVDGQGSYVGNLGVIRDITEQKKLQSQLIVSDRMASVGTLAAGVAHEINNPLAAVIVNLDYVVESLRRMDARDPASASPGKTDAWYHHEMRGALDDARDGARRAALIVRDLKIFSRVPAEEPKRLVHVKAIMESSLRMAWNEIRHRARLVTDYGLVAPVVANEARVGQVFLNLLVNAAQAVPEGRAEHNVIRVSTRQDGKHVIIEVSDTG
ncbi:MAG TPA: PAS domain S-box protein, partial [Polyangiaceae bacterium]